MAKLKQHSKLLQRFAEIYPDPRSELHFNSHYQLLIAVMLSAQCTDKKVNQVTPKLFERYKDFKNLGSAQIAAVEKIIRPINYYKTKAKHIVLTAKMITTQFGGELPRTHQELLALPGVGNKTANVILSEVGIAPAFPVDTHVFRVSKRLGIAHGKDVKEVEQSLRTSFQPHFWRPLHHWLILHGRRVCKAQSPICTECPIAALCEKNL